MTVSLRMMCALVSLVLLVPNGCKSREEKAHQQMISLMNEYADLLSGIKSNTDVVDAKPKLERLGARVKDLAVANKDLPKPSAQEEAKLQKEFEADSKKVAQRIQTEMERLMKIGVSPMDLMSAMQVDPQTLGD